MKVVILAGGKGTRMSEETHLKPKPMVEIGGMPILWHIMKNFNHYGINDFVICCGYKGNIIKNYFKNIEEDWNVTCVNTGLNSMTGGRLKRIKKLVEEETFCFTYGDTLNDVKINSLINFHKKKSKIATVTACQPTEKYGILDIKNNTVVSFKEKPPMKNIWVNGGYFILEPNVFDYIKDDSTTWEKEPMNELVKNKQLSAYQHRGFYQHMDTISEKKYLNKLWESDNAKWKIWE
ncbi:glucose-1-phosphate cytidylyltransferase [Nitrosopumilus sp.]|nr:glucose-1-phosphate cytidylyltransferase [Nitrosopumilus sp.]